MVWLDAVPAGLQCLLLLFLPESPRIMIVRIDLKIESLVAATVMKNIKITRLTTLLPHFKLIGRRRLMIGSAPGMVISLVFAGPKEPMKVSEIRVPMISFDQRATFFECQPAIMYSTRCQSAEIVAY
ncbi:hypothetical protein C8Q78DRAFT_383069 [Trametes maxima]|nr:hypothetical protein C8Q78DRAFT_383069 [Trametes maxima]